MSHNEYDDYDETTHLTNGNLAAAHESQKQSKLYPYFRWILVFISASTILYSLDYLRTTFYLKNNNPIGILDTHNIFDDHGRYIMRNFDIVKPMSNFLNGIGGFWGVPMWAFYVNRGTVMFRYYYHHL